MTDNRMYIANDEDAALQPVDAAACDTVKFLWRELSWEYRRIVPGVEMAAVQLPFATDVSAVDAPSHAHVWISNVQFDGDQVSGRQLNDPEWIAGRTAVDAGFAPMADLEDWMSAVDGQIYGGHPIDAMCRTMSLAECAEDDAPWGLDFAETGAVRPVPAPVQERKRACSARCSLASRLRLPQWSRIRPSASIR
ncbi:DUF2314 domain-containing protein [Xanthomonas fragariae]|uniref:DUF2314 domain-containing protein n=1 Tax=Xanthomonas fragariae TaxID=48664 RepID=UPI001EE02CCE|nr:DUF2314 domain-containing protein [Xanthomonas fragariae]